jgi:hypothetical protein
MAAVREAAADVTADVEDSTQRRGEEDINTGDSMEQERDGKGKNAPLPNNNDAKSGRRA